MKRELGRVNCAAPDDPTFERTVIVYQDEVEVPGQNKSVPGLKSMKTTDGLGCNYDRETGVITVAALGVELLPKGFGHVAWLKSL